MRPLTRAPKQLGEFGEGLVTYLLIRNGYEVAVVDHVGADLIAEKEGRRFAISVKTRLFREGSKESRSFLIEDDHLKKLDHFANLFGLTSLFSQVVCLADAKKIHVCALSKDFIQTLPRVQDGYALRMQKQIDITRLSSESILYACLHEEEISSTSFL